MFLKVSMGTEIMEDGMVVSVQKGVSPRKEMREYECLELCCTGF